MNNKHKQHGFHLAALSIIIIVGLIGVLGFVGYNAWQRAQANAGDESTVGSAKPSAQGKVLTVGTYNLRSQRWDGTNKNYASWAVRKSRINTVVDKSAAHIIGMQEVIKRNPDTLRASPQRDDVVDFMKKLGYDSFVGKIDNSSPVFWKKDTFKELSSKSIDIFNPQSSQDVPAARYLSVVRLTHKKRNTNLVVLNYHFNQHGKTQEQLKALGDEVSSLRQQYPEDTIIFTGDFNNYEHQVRSKLRDSGVVLQQADENQGIDHVFVDKSMSKVDWKDLGGNPQASDHPMIKARISF